MYHGFGLRSHPSPDILLPMCTHEVCVYFVATRLHCNSHAQACTWALYIICPFIIVILNFATTSYSASIYYYAFIWDTPDVCVWPVGPLKVITPEEDRGGEQNPHNYSVNSFPDPNPIPLAMKESASHSIHGMRWLGDSCPKVHQTPILLLEVCTIEIIMEKT